LGRQSKSPSLAKTVTAAARASLEFIVFRVESSWEFRVKSWEVDSCENWR